MVAAAAALVALAPAIPNEASAAPPGRRRARRSPTSAIRSPWGSRRTSCCRRRIGSRHSTSESVPATCTSTSPGKRSAIERHDGRPNAVEAAEEPREEGFNGCWVTAIGTNDAANVAAGSSYGASERIDRVMEVVGDDLVLWVDAKTTTTRASTQRRTCAFFNQALAKAHARHPTLEVFHWSDVARISWFESDGIHYTSTGYARRAALIAAAVAKAFPARSADD